MARKKLGEILVAAGAATENQVKKALGHQRNFPSQRLGEVLCALEGMTRVALGRALAEQFNLPYIDLPEVEGRVSALVPLDFQSEHRVVPFRLEVEGKSERLHLAVADPSNLALLDDLRFRLRRSVRIYVAPMDQIDDHLARARNDAPKTVEAIPLATPSDLGTMEVERQTAQTQAGGWFTVAPSEVDPFAGDLDALLGNPPAGAQAQAKGDLFPPAPPAEPPPPSTPRAEVTLFQPSREPSRPAAEVSLSTPEEAGAEGAGTTMSHREPEAEARPTPRALTVDEAQILEQIERLAAGEEIITEPERVRPERMVAALVRLLMKKGMIHELEFLDELAKK